MHFGVASGLVCSHLATQTSHGTSEINHDTRVFNPLALEQRQESFYFPSYLTCKDDISFQ